jgi:hypothetical protein
MKSYIEDNTLVIEIPSHEYTGTPDRVMQEIHNRVAVEMARHSQDYHIGNRPLFTESCGWLKFCFQILKITPEEKYVDKLEYFLGLTPSFPKLF